MLTTSKSRTDTVVCSRKLLTTPIDSETKFGRVKNLLLYLKSWSELKRSRMTIYAWILELTSNRSLCYDEISHYTKSLNLRENTQKVQLAWYVKFTQKLSLGIKKPHVRYECCFQWKRPKTENFCWMPQIDSVAQFRVP